MLSFVRRHYWSSVLATALLGVVGLVLFVPGLVRVDQAQITCRGKICSVKFVDDADIHRTISVPCPPTLSCHENATRSSVHILNTTIYYDTVNPVDITFEPIYLSKRVHQTNLLGCLVFFAPLIVTVLANKFYERLVRVYKERVRVVD